MFDFIIRKPIIQNAQRHIDRLTPKIDVHVPEDLPLPSVAEIRRMSGVVSRINALEPEMMKRSDTELRACTDTFRERYEREVREAKAAMQKAREELFQAANEQQRTELSQVSQRAREEFKKIRQQALDAILPEAFALVREAGRRTIGLRHFDVQLMGGIVLHEGKIAEMTTGEGKTLVCTTAAYLNGLTGEGVHVVTVNDYLAKRDREWMGPIYEFLGLSVGVIVHELDPGQRQAAYGCDITYGTNNEFGFDYLRDNMVTDARDMVQREFYFGIVDEVDSILIDEARTPLIISGPAEESTDKYYTARDVAARLKGRRITEAEQIEAKHRGEENLLTQGVDYIADEKSKTISMTEEGEVHAAKLFGVDNLHDMETIEFRHHILQALRAKEFFKKDVDYVVRDGEVIIVDEFTGRMMPGRRWSDGLHQAVESMEGIKIERENQTLATITFQNFFRMYDKLSGMTGTAYTEANEFREIYKLDCVVLPTNKVLQRKNYSDGIYKTTKEKYAAVVQEIADCYRRGQPVLVGTISIEKSELLSAFLKREGVPHQVLNAKYHELEAQIVAQAGRHKAVTIATNMAGRGTDIMLGGNAEFLARRLAAQEAKEDDTAEAHHERIQKFLDQFRSEVAAEHELVVQAGGLHVLGTERHESRRIDNQLRGRSGRQGDPGSSKFFVSLEDDLMRLFGSDRIMGVMDKLGMEEGQVIEHPWVTRALEIAQKRVENYNFEIRKQLLEYDNVMNLQREAIYGLRRDVLEKASVKDMVLEAVRETTDTAVDNHWAGSGTETGPDVEGLQEYLRATFNWDLGAAVQREMGGKETPWPEEFVAWGVTGAKDFIYGQVAILYDQKEQESSVDQLRFLEKAFLLNMIDTKWKDHLHAMDLMREGVGLRAYGQRDPLVEYKREGFKMFQEMYRSINQEVAETIFKLRLAGPPQRLRSVFFSVPQQLVHNDFSGLEASRSQAQGQMDPAVPPQGGPMMSPHSSSAPAPVHKTGPKVGRNDPCPCGSGKKYKKCCGRE